MAVNHNTKVMMNKMQVEREMLELEHARKEANTNRLQNNIKILALLANFMETHEDLRFCQVLNILGLDKDRFYEEPNDTIIAIERRIAELENVENTSAIS